MRFNVKEIKELASQHKCEKEGNLFFRERQDGFFRKTEVSNQRWCKLRGNLLFYFKSNDQFSEPSGVIVLEKYRVTIPNEPSETFEGYPFYIEFDDGLNQRLGANTIEERNEWVQALRIAGYDIMRAQLQYLREQIEKRRASHKMDVDVEMHRLQTGNMNIDFAEVPICESVISCDNLICDAYGKAPNASIVVQVTSSNGGWIKYGRTEVIEKSSNPQFLCTIVFRASDGLNASTMIRFTAYDVREKVSQTAVPLGFAEISLGVIQDTSRLRIPIRSQNNNVGFITIVTFTPENDKKLRSPAKLKEHQSMGHRRSQSLPPKLGVKLFIPNHMKLPLLFTNPCIRTYRAHSGLAGGDISVHEFMLESMLCFIIPQQLLSIWIMREKELLQEISAMGELGGEWKNKQLELLDAHLRLLRDYSQAKQSLQYYNGRGGKYFKPSAKRNDESLEFAPINLHLQRMVAHNDTLKKSGCLDIMTVGAFTRHTGKQKTGGLIKLLHQIKDTPTRTEQVQHKVQAANDVVQSIKQLRKEIVEIMSQLLLLAKTKSTKNMIPLCNEMMSKTRALLNIWEPSLVEEAFRFIEQHRIIDEPDNTITPLSPFKKITQQLCALDLKSPELEDFATPNDHAPDLWPQKVPRSESKLGFMKAKSPSATDINAITNAQNAVHSYQNYNTSEKMSMSLPPIFASDQIKEQVHELKFSETHFDINGDVSSSALDLNVENGCSETKENNNNENENDMRISLTPDQLLENKNELLSSIYDENGYLIENTSIVLNHNGAFLDTKAMTSSDFYRPSEEPEPLDLTQLNIEASVMCLVSKVKFLCGRCGSPAVRLRQPRNSISSLKRDSMNNDVVTSQPISENGNINSSSITLTNGSKLSNNMPSKDLNLALTEAVGEVTRKVKKGNKFTDGLDLSSTTDWASELRPSMKKLRQAMDGLLKTARLIHSVQRLHQDTKKITSNLAIMYRRDVCFSQALTTLITSLMAKFWGTNITEHYVNIICALGPLVYFEGYLSLYGSEADFWSDMNVAIEDLSTVNFTLVRHNGNNTKTMPTPRIHGSRQSLFVYLPVPDYVYAMLPPSNGQSPLNRDQITFKVTPVFFNIGINEVATLAESLGYCKEQHRSNFDNFDRLKRYHIMYKKIPVPDPKANSNDTSPKNYFIQVPSSTKDNAVSEQVVINMLDKMEELLRINTSKNIKVLHVAQDITRALNGLRVTSCKSAKDRTGMAVTLEQARILQQEFHLPNVNLQNVLDVMRSEGTRLDNTFKNICRRKYAFNLPQVLALPQLYRPPTASFGKAQS
ncbi:inositol polyphosphate-4-phosphatase type I A isoform X2 [Chironomus tepperi]|uniref:inositol polyphosphate-4-phosphatase type I A isoform X2 n=1 Tax=Chironomus tepperi TaxID=113505 RepID=UPI00391F96BF